MGWLSSAWGSISNAAAVAWIQAQQAAQVAASQAAAAAQQAASQAAEAAKVAEQQAAQNAQAARDAAAPLIPQAVALMSNAVLPGASALMPAISVSAFNKQNTNTTSSLTDQSVRVDYSDSRAVASDGGIIAQAGSGVQVSQAGPAGNADPQSFGYGGAVAASVQPGSTEAAASTLGGAVDAGSPIPGTVAGVARSRLWLYVAAAAALLAVVFLIRRK